MSVYSDLKEVGKDAWSVGTSAAEYVFGEKDITGTPTRPENYSIPVEEIPEGSYGDQPYKPTSGNETFDTVLEWFL